MDEPEVIVVDGSNVACRKDCSPRALLEAEQAIAAQYPNAQVIVFVDRSWIGRNRHNGTDEDRALLDRYGDRGNGRWTPEPPDTKADEVILRTAEGLGASVISQDQYHDYQRHFPFLTEPGRRIAPSFAGGRWVFVATKGTRATYEQVAAKLERERRSQGTQAASRDRPTARVRSEAPQTRAQVSNQPNAAGGDSRAVPISTAPPHSSGRLPEPPLDRLPPDEEQLMLKMDRLNRHLSDYRDAYFEAKTEMHRETARQELESVQRQLDSVNRQMVELRRQADSAAGEGAASCSNPTVPPPPPSGSLRRSLELERDRLNRQLSDCRDACFEAKSESYRAVARQELESVQRQLDSVNRQLLDLGRQVDGQRHPAVPPTGRGPSLDRYFEEERSQARRNDVILVCTIVAVLLVAAIGAWLLLRGPSAEWTTTPGEPEGLADRCLAQAAGWESLSGIPVANPGGPAPYEQADENANGWVCQAVRLGESAVFDDVAPG